MCKISSKLTIKTPEKCKSTCSGVFFVYLNRLHFIAALLMSHHNVYAFNQAKKSIVVSGNRSGERERNRQKRKQTKEEIRTSLENLMGYVNFSFMLYEFNVGYVQREKYSICYTTTSSSSSSSNLYLQLDRTYIVSYVRHV